MEPRSLEKVTLSMNVLTPFLKSKVQTLKLSPHTGDCLLHKRLLLPFIYSFDRNVLNSDDVPNTIVNHEGHKW